MQEKLKPTCTTDYLPAARYRRDADVSTKMLRVLVAMLVVN
jgi:hypothetical protein